VDKLAEGKRKVRCLVTAGPTYEPVDAVRRITNFSTGRLGTLLAAFLQQRGYEVILLRGRMSSWGEVPYGCRVISFGTTEELIQALEQQQGTGVDAVFHVAAVSDFRPVEVRSSDGKAIGQIGQGKIPSRTKELWIRLVPSPKVIDRLRGWFPRAWIVGWKYEVEGTQAEALARGQDQIRRTRTDGCVVNGPAYGPGFGWISGSGEKILCPDESFLFEVLEQRLQWFCRSISGTSAD